MIGITALHKMFLPLLHFFHVAGRKNQKADLFWFTEDDYNDIF
jgi:hypothetical protein